MAYSQGLSGPLEDVLRVARSLGLDPCARRIDELDAHERRVAAQVAFRRAEAERAVRAEIQQLESALIDLEVQDDEERAAVESEALAGEAHERSQEKRVSSDAGILGALLAPLRLWRIRVRLDRWRRWRMERLRDIETRIDDRRRQLARLTSDPAAEVARRVRNEQGRLDAIRWLLASPETTGARAEVRVADVLSGLSDEFVVLNHLRLRAPHFLRHNGKPVVSAEIDHVVVGPTGVYLVETKCWGARFVSGGAYFDPFEQADRAGLLCHVLLNEAGLPARVQRIITPFASLPSPPAGSWARVVCPDRLRRYIERGRGELGPEDVRAIAEFLWENFHAV